VQLEQAAMTETSPQLGDVEKAIIADEIGLETGIYGQYRLKTSYQPIFRRDGATLALFGLEARLAPQLAGKQITAAEFFEQVAPVDRRFVETLSRVLHLRNHRNIGADNIANLRLYLTIDPDLDMHDRGAGSLDSIARIAEEADLSPAMIICEILDAPEFPMDRLAGIANELCGCGMQISIAAFRAGKSAIDRVTLIGPNVIKIDGAWFRGVQDKAETARLFPAVLTAFKGLGAKLLVQGIETSAELEAALNAGADYLQGRLLAGPALVGTVVDDSLRPVARLLAREDRKIVPFGRHRKG
jgi:EAL domain-containing protein (putative c-di-GMP-specific phosphodiesterase class I)